MQNFVRARDRAASPQHAQNGPHINPERRAIAANAKVSMKKGPTTHQTHQTQVPLGIPSRGFGNAQNSSAVIQHAPHRRPSGQGNKVASYDTDAESIDTTVNQSVIQVDDSQVKDLQYQQLGEAVDLGSEEADDDEEGSGDEEEGEEEHDEGEADTDADAGGYGLTQEEAEYLQRKGLTHLTEKQAIDYVAKVRPEGFRTVERTIDGDSYPSTTEGDPTEWDGDQERTFEEQDEGGFVSPLPQRSTFNSHRPLAPQPMHHGPYAGGTGQAVHSSHNLFKQGAHLRGQQLKQGFPPMIAAVQSSQPPSYSQANRDPVASQALNPNNRQHHQAAFVQLQQAIPWQQPGPVHGQAHLPTPKETLAPTKRPSSTRNKVIPIIQHPPPVEQAPVQHAMLHPDGDYDPEVLDAMSYDQLKNESFDTNPRLTEQPLSGGILQKPLVERLKHVQKNFDPIRQSEFFRTLPTEEWEDAGDWFLDQFSSIIDRTKKARKQKRKLTQGFEDEIEKRHKHVSKKQHQVEDAMQKMQAQGEGLVPRSPRPSKSPKPRKR